MRAMTPDVERFLRNTHILARLVEQIFETGYLRRTSGEAVTFDQLNILKFLSRPQTTLVKDVARFLNASCAAASKAVSRLERKELVSVEPYERDRRAESIEVTPKGKAVVRKYEKMKEARVRSLLKGVDSSTLSKALEQTIALIMKERSIANDPCLGCGAYYAKNCMVRLHGQRCACQGDGN